MTTVDLTEMFPDFGHAEAEVEGPWGKNLALVRPTYSMGGQGEDFLIRIDRMANCLEKLRRAQEQAKTS